MSYKIAIPQPITNPGREYLINRGYEIIDGDGNTEFSTLKALLADADGLLARTADYPAEVLSAGERLKVIGRHGVGTDNLDLNYCRQNGIWVAIAANANANAVAEHTIGFILTASHRLAYLDRETRIGNWEVRNKSQCRDVIGKKLAVLGMGRIGRLVAQKAALGLEMQVLGYDPYCNQSQFPDYITWVTSMEEAVSQADFVSLHMPSSPETDNLVNREFLTNMKKTAYLINCARGAVVDEKALLWALENHEIAGAACDVFLKEPASAENPLFALDNITVSPHSAALTIEAMNNMGLEAAQAIDSVLSGRIPNSPVVSH